MSAEGTSATCSLTLSAVDYDRCPLVKPEVAGEDHSVASSLWCGYREGEDSKPYVFH